MTAFYDFFRYIKLYSTDGTTLEATLEGDSVTDSLNISRGNGVAFTGANAGTDSFKIDVDYDLTVPVSTTSIRLSDVNSNNKDIALVAGGNMTIVRDSANQLTISALIGGVSKSISAITQANPARVTTTNPHGFTEGTPVTIVDVVGMTNVNGNEYFMNVIDGNNFDLYTDDLLSTTLDSTGFPAYTSGGVATADYGGAKQAFKTIRVAGQTDIVADTIADLLTLTETNGLTISTTPATDTIDFAFSGGLDNLSDVKFSGTNFNNSIKIGDTTTGTLATATQNVIIGVGAYNTITSADDNVVIGYNAGAAGTTGGENVIIGKNANATSKATSSVIIGKDAASLGGATDNVYRSVIIGTGAGNGNGVTGNVAIGYQAGTGPTDNSNENIAIGTSTIKYVKGTASATATYNVAIGYEAMKGAANLTESDYNVAIGAEALTGSTTGSKNVAIGYQAGMSITDGGNNVIIGNYAGTTSLADTVAIYTGGGTERLTINSSGGSINTDTIATLTATQTLTNKTINGPDNTLTNIANSSLANSSITFARVGGNSTAASLGDTVSFQGTAGEVTVGENSGTFTIGLPANVAITTGLTVNSDTAVTETATQTLTNKTLTAPTLDIPVYINGFGGDGDMDIFGNARFKSTSAGATANPRIYLSRQSASPAANDVIGGLVLEGYDSNANADREFASIYGRILDPSSSARDGRIEFHVSTSNTVEHSASFEHEYFNLMTEQKIRWHNHKGTTYECDLDWETPTAGRTITFPDANGTVAVSATSPVTLSATGDIGLGTVPIAKGGTGATTAADARTALELTTTSDVQFDSFGVGTAASGTTGEIRATNNITGYYSSDSRLKENIQNIPDALDKVMMLKGVTFDWTDEHIKERGGEDNYFVKKHDTGLIAQDVQQVLPEIVRKKKDGYLGVQYDKTVGLLVEAIKELKAEIDQLKSKG